MKNIITATLLIIAILTGLSSCLTAVNSTGENGTDNTAEEKKDSGTDKTDETAVTTVSGNESQEETAEMTEPTQTEPAENGESYIELFPGELPEKLKKTFEHYNTQTWIQNVNGRYIGIRKFEPDDIRAFTCYYATGYGYHFMLPDISRIYIYDLSTDALTEVKSGQGSETVDGKNTASSETLETYLTEEEVRILFENLPRYLEMNGEDVGFYTDPQLYYYDGQE